MRPGRRHTQMHPREPSSPVMTNRDDGGDQRLLSNNSSSTLFLSTDVTVGAQHRCWQEQMVTRGSSAPCSLGWALRDGERLACAVCRGWARAVFPAAGKIHLSHQLQLGLRHRVNIWSQWGVPSHRCREAGRLALTVPSETGTRPERKGVLGHRGRAGLAREGDRWAHRPGWQWLSRLCFLLFLWKQDGRWKGKGKRKTRKECFLLNLVRGEMATAITTVSTQIITPPPQKFWERKKQQVFSFSALTSVPAISWKQPLHIPSVWNMNTHSSNKFPSPPPLNAGQVRGRERVFMSGPSLPGSLLHKEEISVHSVYLFCVEKPRAINHEEIHSTLFHFTLLSTTLYRVSEWIFNIVPQNALVSYQTLGRYPSDNTGEFWEILSAEETALKFSHSDGM